MVEKLSVKTAESRKMAHEPGLATSEDASNDPGSLRSEVPPLEGVKDMISSARARFVQDMAYGLIEAAIRSHDAGDWDGLGQAVVDWTSTLELEADKPLRRRMQRRRLRARNAGSI